MEKNQTDGSVKFRLGEREVCLCINGRAARLILEQTGVDVYQRPGELFEVDAAKLNIVFWATLQNRGNGEPGQWLNLAEVEEYLDTGNFLDAVQALILALTPLRGENRAVLGNALAEARNRIDSAILASVRPAAPSAESPPTNLTT